MAHPWSQDYSGSDGSSPTREPIRVKRVTREMKQQKLGAAFRDAAQRGELHVMHMLTREGLCDVECPDEEGNSALLLACAAGDVVEDECRRCIGESRGSSS